MKTKDRDSLRLYGRWQLEARHIKTGEIIVKEGKNLICAVGKGLVGDLMIDTAGFDVGLTFCAIGSDNTAPNVADTTLTVEEFRKAVTSRSRTVNEITITTFFTAGESTYAIEEAGIFGHSTASATPDSGIIFSHWLVSFDNSGGVYDITISYILTIG